MSQTIYVVVGASRGIGQEIVNQLSQSATNHIIATTRRPIEFGKHNVENIILDQTNSDSVSKAVAQVLEADVLVVNAAMGEQEYLLSTSTERLQQYVETNIVGVHRVINSLIPALRSRNTRKIIIISSSSGSNTKQRGVVFGLQGPYAVTKAANNMQAVQYHNELNEDGFSVITLHPGWVDTDMGNLVQGNTSLKPMPVSESAGNIINRIQELKHEDSGKFYLQDGSVMPW